MVTNRNLHVHPPKKKAKVNSKSRYRKWQKRKNRWEVKVRKYPCWHGREPGVKSSMRRKEDRVLWGSPLGQHGVHRAVPFGIVQKADWSFEIRRLRFEAGKAEILTVGLCLPLLGASLSMATIWSFVSTRTLLLNFFFKYYFREHQRWILI